MCLVAGLVSGSSESFSGGFEGHWWGPLPINVVQPTLVFKAHSVEAILKHVLLSFLLIDCLKFLLVCASLLLCLILLGLVSSGVLLVTKWWVGNTGAPCEGCRVGFLHVVWYLDVLHGMILLILLVLWC